MVAKRTSLIYQEQYTDLSDPRKTRQGKARQRPGKGPGKTIGKGESGKGGKLGGKLGGVVGKGVGKSGGLSGKGNGKVDQFASLPRLSLVELPFIV